MSSHETLLVRFVQRRCVDDVSGFTRNHLDLQIVFVVKDQLAETVKSVIRKRGTE